MIYKRLINFIFTIILVLIFNTALAADTMDNSRKNCYLKKPAKGKGIIYLHLGRAVELSTKTKIKISCVSVGEEEIADVTPLSANSIRMIGLKKGSTNFIVSYENNYCEEYILLVNGGYRVEVLEGITTNEDRSLTGW